MCTKRLRSKAPHLAQRVHGDLLVHVVSGNVLREGGPQSRDGGLAQPVRVGGLVLGHYADIVATGILRDARHAQLHTLVAVIFSRMAIPEAETVRQLATPNQALVRQCARVHGVRLPLYLLPRGLGRWWRHRKDLIERVRHGGRITGGKDFVDGMTRRGPYKKVGGNIWLGRLKEDAVVVIFDADRITADRI